MKLDSFKLKLFAMILMILDHLHTYIPNMPVWFPWLGRLVSPIFFFFIVEGFFHTRNKFNYAKRIFIWSFVMFAGSKSITLLFPREISLHNNIFLSMGLSVVLMSIIEWTKKRRKNPKQLLLGVVLAIIVSGLSLITEASFLGVLMTLVFYFFRGKKLGLSLGYLAICAFEFFTLASAGLTYENLFILNFQWMQVFALPIFFMYNGQRGLNNNFTKYLFYIFYPTHLWIIYTLGYFIKP